MAIVIAASVSSSVKWLLGHCLHWAIFNWLNSIWLRAFTGLQCVVTEHSISLPSYFQHFAALLQKYFMGFYSLSHVSKVRNDLSCGKRRLLTCRLKSEETCTWREGGNERRLGNMQHMNNGFERKGDISRSWNSPWEPNWTRLQIS